MIQLLGQLVAIAIVIFYTSTASAASGTFYTTAVPYHGPSYADPSGMTHVGCYGAVNVRVYESDHFIIYSDISNNDNIRIKLARMAETEFAADKTRLNVTDTDLGINTADPSTKLHICSDGVSSGATGDSTGVSMPALDGSNNDPLDMLFCYAGYRNTLRHEMVHVIHGTLANDNLSGIGVKNELWFSEGLAVYLSDSSNLSSPGGILSDTVSMAAYFTSGRPNPVSVKTRADMPGLNNSDVYPAFALTVKYLFDSASRGGADNNLLSLKGMFQQIDSGVAFTTAFANTFTKDGTPLSVANYTTNFQSWMTTYLGARQTPATVTGVPNINMVGIFKYWCDMIIGIGANVTSGNFALNVSELADGPYALCVMDNSGGKGPATVTVSGGRLVPTSYDISTWPALSNETIPISFGSTSGTGTISVLSSDVCDWVATSNDSWITITSGSSGSGNGTVTYSVAANSGGARTGSMTIDGQNFTVTQAETCANGTYKVGSITHIYSTIQEAYNALPDGDTMQIQALVFTGGLLLNLDKTVTLKGGYGCDFTLNPGYAIISDKITISTGKATLENLIIQ